jgi:predicted dehydrogenase
MFDMGPYYLTALINLIGPVKRVSGMTSNALDERTITSEKKYGNKVKVEVPTHIAGLMEFRSGAIGTIITSFDVWGAHLPCIEIHGTEGSISVPDPNTFGGKVMVKRGNHGDWNEVPLTHIYAENSRGLSACDMAYSLEKGIQNRANGELGYHVLDIMHAFHESWNKKKFVVIYSTCKRPRPMPIDCIQGYIS